MQLRLLLLLSTAQLCVPLQRPMHSHDPPPTPHLFSIGGPSMSSTYLNGRWHPVAVSGHVSPVTSSEASEPVFEAFVSGSPASNDDRRRWDSPHLGANEVAEWVPPDDWQLPPPVLGLREQAPMDSEGGTSFEHETSAFDSQGTSLLSSSPPPYQALPAVASEFSGGTAQHRGSLAGDTWTGRPLCHICKLKEASKASISSDGKNSEWDIFACRFCASAVSLQQKTTMHKLRGRCTRCPRYATFAPPGYPQHISLHCKAHKWPGEVAKAKRLHASVQYWQPFEQFEDDHPRDRVTKETSPYRLVTPLSLEDSDSAMQILWSASERTSASESALEEDRRAHRQEHAAQRHGTRAVVIRSKGRGRSMSLGAIPTRRSSERPGTDVHWGVAVAAGNGRSRSCCANVAPPDHCGGFVATCSDEGCTAVACFGTGGVALSCKRHSRPGQIRLLAQRRGGMCNYVGGCAKRASFGDAEQGVARFCADHKLGRHTNVRATRCTATDCQVQSTFGPPWSRKPIWCSKHRRQGDVDLRHGRRASAAPHTAPTVSNEQAACDTPPIQCAPRLPGRRLSAQQPV